MIAHNMIVCITMLIWDVFIWGGTTFLISERGWSGWWFVLTFCLTIHPQYRKKKSND